MPLRMFGRLGKPFGYLTLSLTLATPALGQMAQLQQVNVPDSSVYGKDNTSGVYVRDSAVALEKLAHAQRMEGLKEWGTSAELYQEILEKYPDRVVPAGVDKSDRIIQYTSVTEAVRQALCKWPPDGLDVYRGKYETPAANLLASMTPGDLSRLHQVFALYFVTDAAKQAGLQLMDAYFELGDYAAVGQIGRRLLDWHPNLIAERPRVLYRVAMAEKLCGDPSGAKKRLDELQSHFPQVAGTIRGTDVILADSLAQELASDARVVRGETSDSWLTLGGDESRGKISSAHGKPGAKLYSINLGQPSWKQISDANQRHGMEQQDQAQRRGGLGLGVMPAVDRGELFFQDNSHVYGISLESGVPLSGWAATYPNQNGQYTLPESGSTMPIGQEMCVTLTDKFVTAVMGLPDHIAMANGLAGARESRLVCLDRETGKEIWTTSVRNVPDDQGALRSLQIGGSPLVVGQNVYVVGRGGKGQQFEDCYVLCFDLANGKFRWGSYVASANSQSMMMTAQGMIVMNDSVSHLAYASGRLYIMSDLGAAAALDAYSGTILWLDIYREDDGQQVAAQPFIGFGMGPNPGAATATAPWLYNPIVVQSGRVFVFPSDSKYIFIYDAGTGKELKRIALSDFVVDDPTSPPTTLLMVDDEALICGGANRVWRMPWVDYDHDKNPKPRGFWLSAVLAHSESSNDTVRGRGFVTADSIYMPTDWALWRVLLKSGMLDKTNATFPRTGWEEGQQGPGNVLVTQEHVVIAGDRRVDVYTDLDMARAKLEQNLAAAPNDPQPRLLYAEVMFVAGQSKVAADKLDEAINLMGGLHNLQAGPARDRAFNDALTFAGKLVTKHAPVDEIDAMYDRAASAAQSSAQQVAYRMSRAKFDVQTANSAAAVDRYQQILSDENMRLVAIPDPENGGSSQAAIVADKMIAAMLAGNDGRAAYAKYEKLAADQLAAARTANDPAQMLAVARTYPDSTVARESMFAAADNFETKGDSRQATQVLRQILNRYHDSGKAAVMESMARNYIKIPGRLDVAVSRLAIAAVISPGGKLSKPLTLPDGSVLQDATYAQAHDALAKYSAKASTDLLPDFQLPTRQQRVAYRQAQKKNIPPFLPELKINNVANLLTPQEGFERFDRILTWNAESGVSVYPVGSASPVGADPSITQAPVGAAWVNGKALVWSGSTLHLIGDDKPQWHLDLGSLPSVDVTADDAAPALPVDPNAMIPGQANAPGIRIRIQGQRLRGGALIMRPPVPLVAAPVPAPDAAPAGAEQIARVVPVSDRVIVTTTTGRVFALDSTDGHVAWQTRLSAHAPDQIVANDDFTVVRMRDDAAMRIIVLNSYSGELVGRKGFVPGAVDCISNIALSPDGTLAYTTTDRLGIFDLFDATIADQGMTPKHETKPMPENPQLFLSCDQPQDLMIAQGRIYAASDFGRNLRVYSVETGEPITITSAESNGVSPLLLSTLSKDAVTLMMQVSGGSLFVRHSAGVIRYPLNDPSNAVPFNLIQVNANIVQWFFGKDHVVLLWRRNRPITQTNKVDLRSVTMQTYSRAAMAGHPERESGEMDFAPEISDPSGITDWQAVEGGLVYHTGDGVLHELLGARGKPAR